MIELFSRLGLTLLLLITLPLPSAATIAHSMTLEDLVLAADRIVIATADSQDTFWSDGRLYTLVQLRVGETLEGRHEPTVEMIFLGGIDLDRPVPVQVSWAGMPRVTPGQQMLLFLAPDPDFPAYQGPVGARQGLHTIVHHPDTGEPLVGQDLHELQLVDVDGNRRGQVRYLPLAHVRAEIARILGTP